MKKNLIALLIVALVTVGLFAANPDSVGFNVTTNVSGINLMKITQAAFTGTTENAFTQATAYGGTLNVSSSGTQTFSAYISTLSNSRVGYKVTMSATAMKSTETVGQSSVDAFIHYTVTANSQSVDTSNKSGGPGSNGKVVIDTLTSGMSGVAPASHQISLTVDKDSFDAAVEGTYTGTVTFTWTTT